MPRIAATLALVCGLMLLMAAPARAQDRDCSDFDTQAEAQDFFERAGSGDPHRLDADGDGRACDSNPCPCRGPGGGQPRRPAQPPPSQPRPQPKRAQTIKSVIVREIDGDTIVVRPLEETRRPRYTVRLLGIDSPEMSPRECGANLATENARRLAPRGRRVLLKTDPTQPLFDRFDRLLAYAKLRNGPQLNKAQITRGWAKVLLVGRRFQQYGSFKRAARRAKELERGAWGMCGGMHVMASAANIAQPRDRSCRSVRGGEYLATNLHAQKVTCRSARGKLRRWLRRGRLPRKQNGWFCYREEGTRICSYLGGPSLYAPNFYFQLQRT
jgi:endonuclease YncB( thermonuclease family)